MLTFDTIKIAFPSILLSAIDYQRLTEYPEKKDNSKKAYSQKHLAPGFTSIRISSLETAIEFTAKILKADYPKLISASTIEQALENLLAASPATFDVHEVLSTAHVTKCHQTQDLALSKPFGEYAKLITELYVNPGYNLTTYKDETVTFSQNIKAVDKKHREYFKLYDKEKEYKRTTDVNTNFRERLTKQEKENVATYYKRKTRVETEFNTKRKLRQHFPDISKEIKLTDLLLSISNPLEKQFTEITKQIYMTISNSDEAKTIDFLKGLDFDSELQFAFLEKFNYDLNKIDYWLKEKKVAKSTAIRKRKEFKALLADYKAHQVDSSCFASLHELKETITIGTMVPKMELTNISPISKPTEKIEPPLTIDTMVPNLTPVLKVENSLFSRFSKKTKEQIEKEEKELEKELKELAEVEIEDDYLPW